MLHTMKLKKRITEKKREKKQSGFMLGKSITDAIFSLRQLLKKHQKKRSAHGLYQPKKNV